MFSPDGRTLAASASRSRSWDDIIRVWDVATGAHKHTLAGHSSNVTSIAFSPNGQLLASGSGDDTIRLWDVITGAYTGILAGHTGAIISVAFSPDGQTLSSGSRDGTTLLWKLTPLPNANAIVRAEPSPVRSPTIGVKLTLALNIAGGENVAGYQATVQFAPTALRYIESGSGDYFPADAFFMPPLVVRNRVTIAATTRAGESKSNDTLIRGYQPRWRCGHLGFGARGFKPWAAIE